jgi:bifunctional enzyme CysN/CysC
VVAFVWAESESAARTVTDALDRAQPVRIETIVANGEDEFDTSVWTGPGPAVAVLRCDSASGLTDAVLRQTYLLKLSGARRILLAITGDDRGAGLARFDAIAAKFHAFVKRAEIDDADVLPLAELAGRVSGFAAEEFTSDAALRLRIHKATRLAQKKWHCRGTFDVAVPRLGQAVTVLPAEKQGRITQLDEHQLEAVPAIGAVDFELETEAPLKAGAILAGDPPPDISDQIAAHVVWTGVQRLYPGRTYLLRIFGETVAATVTALKHRIDPRNLEPRAARFLQSGDIGFCNLALERPVVFDRDPRRSYGTHFFHLLDRRSNREIAAGFPAYGLRRATNLTRQDIAIGGAARAASKGQRPCVLWFTGLSGAGKSSAASAVDQQLHTLGRHTYMLDGDNVRHGLCRDLGFTEADRVENIRRVAEVARLMVDAGLIVLVSFISPFRSERRMARELFEDGQFVEIFMDTPLTVCEVRDTKGLYRKARAGELVNFTGIDSPYEAPEKADISLRPEDGSPDAQAELVVEFLQSQGMI